MATRLWKCYKVGNERIGAFFMNKKIVKIAAEAMKVTVEVAEENYKEIEKYDAYYFWNPVRGGISVIVGKDGVKLSAVSGLNYEKHLQAYIDGKRN